MTVIERGTYLIVAPTNLPIAPGLSISARGMLAPEIQARLSLILGVLAGSGTRH